MVVKLWWMIHKDLICEWRARRAWPAMLLLGIVVALMFAVQMDLLPEQKPRMVGGLLWLAIFFAGMLAMDRSFAAEREEGCWEGLLLCPLSPAAVYLAKLAVNVVAIGAVQCVLVPLFVVLADVPLLARPWPMILIALLGNVGIAAVGTLLSALAAGIRHGANLSVLLVLPLVIPVVLAAAEATRLVVENPGGAPWWRWTELLAACAVVFVTAGVALFDFVVED
jgi:heme exporter protein B